MARGHGRRCARIVVEHVLAFFRVPVKAISVSMVMEGASLAVVAVAHTEDDGVSVFLVGSVLAGHCIASWTVFGTVKRHPVDRPLRWFGW